MGAVAAVAAAGLAIVPGGAGAAPGGPGQSRAAAIAAQQDRADQVRRSLGLGSEEQLTVRDVIRDADGTTHVRYDRTANGLRTIGGDMVVKSNGNGLIRETYGRSAELKVASTTPAVSKAAAVKAGRRAAPYTPTKATAELVVWARGAKPVLAYDVVTHGVRADQTPSRLHTVVDARTGRTLDGWEEIETGTGNSIYSGRVTISTTQTGTGYEMRDAAHPGNHTTDMKGSQSGTGTIFTDADDIWGDGTTTNRQSAGVDAHYGSARTWDYFKNVLGRNGIFNNGQGVRSRVHYGNAYVNAFWDGTQMTYGDGANNARPLVQLDVAGHEMTHGVTENSAGLVYSGDAGGLNESTSDIFGTMVEFYANNPSDRGDYLVGEKININGNGTPLRYMDKPSRDGRSVDCYSSSTGGLDPHFSSGPLNHWFYLASEGSGAKTINGVSYNSPTCNGSTVTGVGNDAVAKVWYRTLATKLTSTSSYPTARDGAVQSAVELYGAGSAQCATVLAAFKAINVPAGSNNATCGTGTPSPTPTSTPAPSGNLLANPGFESGAVSWTGTSGPITNNTGRPARTGSWKMWLGGNGSTSTETEQQTVTIPSTATTATFSFWVRIDTSESGTTAYDTMRPQVVVNGTTRTLATYSNANANSTYVQKSFDLSSYRGQSVTVKFTMSEDSSLQTSFVVDDTALTTS